MHYLFPFTVVAIYHDNDQCCIQHVMAKSPQAAVGQVQIDVYNEERDQDLRDGITEKEVLFKELAEGEIPDKLRVLAVFDGHITAPISFD